MTGRRENRERVLVLPVFDTITMDEIDSVHHGFMAADP
jgi:hypothetical protein